jgi:hypothetical protein
MIGIGECNCRMEGRKTTTKMKLERFKWLFYFTDDTSHARVC